MKKNIMKDTDKDKDIGGIARNRYRNKLAMEKSLGIDNRQNRYRLKSLGIGIGKKSRTRYRKKLIPDLVFAANFFEF